MTAIIFKLRLNFCLKEPLIACSYVRRVIVTFCQLSEIGKKLKADETTTQTLAFKI